MMLEQTGRCSTVRRFIQEATVAMIAAGATRRQGEPLRRREGRTGRNPYRTQKPSGRLKLQQTLPSAVMLPAYTYVVTTSYLQSHMIA